MKKALFQRALCLLLTVTTLLTGLGFTASASGSTGSLKNPDGNNNIYTTLEEMQSLLTTSSYRKYLSAYAEEQNTQVGKIFKDKDGNPTDKWIIDIVNLMQNGSDAFPVSDWDKLPEGTDREKQLKLELEKLAGTLDALAGDGKHSNASESVYIPAEGNVTWEFSVTSEQAGLYYFKWDYYTADTVESTISSIERSLKINDKVPFDEAASLTLTKFWAYANVDVVESNAEGEPNSVNIDYEFGKGNDGYYKRIETVVYDGKKTVTTYTISQDINGNSMSPEAVQVPQWGTYYCQDTTGYEQGYFLFYVNEGDFRITLEAEREPVVIGGLTLERYDKDSNPIMTYQQYLDKYKDAPDNSADGKVIDIQAEFPDAVSDAAVSITNDNTSAANYPITSKAQLFNVVGENGYDGVGQWAAYKFNVSESGFYNVSMRYLQKALEGMYVCRTIKISGGDYGDSPTVPFLEAYNTQFNYSKDWQSHRLYANEMKDTTGYEGEDFKFYFEEGVEYTIYFECSLGSLKDLIQQVQTSLNNVNDCYLRILQLTGATPDAYRNYKFQQVMPDVLWTFLEEANNLMAVKEGLEKLCGTTGAHIATLETVALLLSTMGVDKGEKIAENMSTLKSYLGTLGTWINNSKLSSMMVDSIYIMPATADDDALADAEAGFFKSLWFEITSFIYSFFTDYNAMGLTRVPDENTTTIDVWLAYGRDQSQIWRTMIDAHDGYTNSTGNAAALKLVTGGTLLPSILSGKGPDVYIGLGSSDVINYAIRDAVKGISGNVSLEQDDKADEYNRYFNEVYYTYEDENGQLKQTQDYSLASQHKITFTSLPYSEYVKGYEVGGDIAYEDANFSQAAINTITLLDVSYGVPQTMGFAMMFYRKDVLGKLGVEVPQSWDELLAVLPVLQTNNMEIGVSYISALDFMIYQEGGSMWKYDDRSKYDSKYAGMQIDLDSDIALEAFDFTCSLYTDYSFPVSFDTSNRFRTGEMPIVVGDYAGIYNTLVVYATEINGLWEFCSLPGSYERDTGEFNYDSLAGVTATVMLNGCSGKEALAAWQFIQWQTGAKVQADYGNRIVALIGPSAKYETANLRALDNLSWTASEKAAIRDQMEHLSSIVNYPGSYIIGRYLKFAFLDAQNNAAEPTDALRGYIDAINSEIERKRQEFKLYTAEDLKKDGLTVPPTLQENQ